MLSSMMVFAADIDLSQESENAVTDPIYQADVAKLSALGLWTLSGEDSEQPVTRGEYAQLIVTILAMKDQKVNTPPIFRDVTSENAYCSAVSILHNLKIVSGDYGSLFRPDDAITYNEAMKMLICALGYNQYADEIGGYPIGYMMTARELGLLINNVSGNDTMTRGSVASFIINAIEVPLLKRYTYGSSASFYSKADNVTILTEYFDIYKINAVINAVGPTRINAGVKLMETVADLNGVTFNVGATNAKDYIGYNVYAYYKEDRNATRSTLLFVEPAKNTVYDLKDDEISSYDPETERLSYFTNIEQGKKSYITIRLTDNIIYNNVRTKDFTREDFETADRIRAIDNNNDGNFEAVFIETKKYLWLKA